MYPLSPLEIQAILKERLPESFVTPAHTEKGHFYKVKNTTYPSATGILQIIKEQGLTDWKMNRALDHIFQNIDSLTPDTVVQMLEDARQAPVGIFHDAGDIGTSIHNYREQYFSDWIRDATRPSKRPADYIPELEYDIRAVSGMRALERFVNTENYVPIATELMLYSKKLKVGGTLDDLGMLNGEFALLDLKTSNQFKDTYWLQIALYAMMLEECTGLVPERYFILKVSKEDGSYKLEELKGMKKLYKGVRALVAMNKCMDHIHDARSSTVQKKTIIL